MTSFSSLRVRLVRAVFLAIAPAWVLMYFIALRTHTDLPWAGFIIGLLALAAAWFGGERYILRQVRHLAETITRLAHGDLESRSGLAAEKGELGELARSLDAMAEALNQRVKEREQVEKNLLNRSFQQTVVSALGQFALVSPDLPALLNQAVLLVSQTLEVEYCGILELQKEYQTLLLRAGSGWKDGFIEKTTVPAPVKTQPSFTLTAGEPVIVEDIATDQRFEPTPYLVEHGVVSSVTVAISGQGGAFGVLGAHTTKRRNFSEDEVHFMLAVGTVLAMSVARKRAETALQKLAAFAQLNPNPALELSGDATPTYYNDAAMRLAESFGAKEPGAILPPNIREMVRHCLERRQGQIRLETQIEGRTLSWALHAVAANQYVHVYVEEITERLNLEAQLRQAQKMESIGQLAAGVAHDFNNMLTIIQGHSGLLLAKPDLNLQLQESAQTIYFAAERAASLTRQLLMFSRKNVIQLALLDLREVVGRMTKMLQRLLGETVTLSFTPPADVPLVLGDVGMIEQVIMNLAVNARDAMPGGGALEVAITTTELDEADIQLQPQARIGKFVRLQVTDTGTGMDQATMSRIFEPFFTTKEVGKGTGLGLATVYGIVKQHHGWIEVFSKPGKGTRFEIYFPASNKTNEARVIHPVPADQLRGGQEMILVVEDEPVLRELAKTILESLGYSVLEAGTGVEALKVWEQNETLVDLLLTDMVMPEGVSGMELAHNLRRRNPLLKVIFASGYSVDEIDSGLIREGQAIFLQKPYTHISLAQAVRECLDVKVAVTPVP